MDLLLLIHVYEAVFLFQVTPGGKADLSQAIAVGDEIVAVNGIECQSRAEAIELVRCSRQKLNIALKRLALYCLWKSTFHY